MPKSVIVLITAALAGIIGFAAGALLFRPDQAATNQPPGPAAPATVTAAGACDCIVCQFPSDHPLQMNKVQFLKYCADKGFYPENDGTIDWSKQLGMAIFDTGNTCHFRTVWRISGAHFWIDQILICNADFPHSPENAQPVLAIWQQILPDIVPLFKELQSRSHPYGPATEKQYKDTYYMYDCSRNNKYFLNYDFDTTHDLMYPPKIKR